MRCREARVPEEIAFMTKPELARRMVERALDTDLPAAWIVGDTVYGSAQPLRAALEERQQAYALAVTCKEYVEVQGSRRRVDQVAGSLTGEDWQILSAGAGSKGPRLFAWARIELAAPEISGWQRWRLLRRSLDEGIKPAEMAYVLVFAPIGTSLEEMVEAFGARWTVEQCFEETKGEAGLDEYEVRSWHGWYRHITLSMLAMAFLKILRANEGEDTPETPAQTPQMPEPRALANHLSLLLTISPGHVGDAHIKPWRDCVITNAEALSLLIYNCRIRLILPTPAKRARAVLFSW